MAETFETGLRAAQQGVEARLDGWLAAGAVADMRLLAAMRHGVLGGGKRLRPFLVIACAGLFGVPIEASIDAAAALECVHCYSLVHDDLPCMDADRLRRGQPTVWVHFDEWTAVLAGDALLTLAFEIVAQPACHPDPAVRSALALLLARAAGGAGMVAGQMLDLQAEKRADPPAPTLAHVQRLQRLKTGALIRAGCEMGAILGAASVSQRAALQCFGDQLGLAFQISDDLLDVEGDAAAVGKAVGKDAAAGKATLVALIGVAAARRRLAEVEAAALAALAPFGAEADALRGAARAMAVRVR